MADDVRIYKGKKDEEDFSVNLSTDIEAINSYRLNGNLQKAKELGKKLAGLTPLIETSEESELAIDFKKLLAPKFQSQDILFQIRVLLVFAAESLLQLKIPAEQLSTTAINAMHDTLRREHSAFYKNISDGAAFTFYYLAMKKGRELETDIGQAFAMLCSVNKNSESFIEAGKIIWNTACRIVEAEIEKAQFIF